MAGSHSYSIRHCYIGGKLNPVKVFEVSFIADVADASFPVFNMPADLGGILLDTSVAFDGVTPPDTLTFSIKDGYGLTMDSGTILASTTKSRLPQNLLFRSGSVTLTGNTTNSAKVKVIFYMI